MAGSVPNVWTQMDYLPPRGQCNYKESFISSRCPCLRFMLHPLKSSSSYECDGCSHHASFHTMENKTEDEIRKRWEQEAKDKVEHGTEAQQRPKKRVRAIEYTNNSSNNSILDGIANVFGSTTAGAEGSTRARGGGAKRPARAASSRAKSRIAEATDEDDTVVELD